MVTPPSPVRVAAVTMVYNEPDFLPIWLRHYARQVGAHHCYVVDHGSDDGSTRRLAGANLMRIPRSPLDEPRRARFISKFVTSLLEWYDWVIHVDVDEIVFADPAKRPNLRRYCARCPYQQVTAIGLNLLHTGDEPDLDPAAPILPQRHWMRFSKPLSKPVLTRRAAVWTPGFHRADTPAVFDELYLMHLRFMDRAVSLRRLARSRAQDFIDDTTNLHHRFSDREWLGHFSYHDETARRDGPDIDSGTPELRAAIAAAFDPAKAGDPAAGRDDGATLWAVPERFKSVF